MPKSRPPIIYVIGGPNGAGKTAFAREFLPAAEVVEFLNADLSEKFMSESKSKTKLVKAGKPAESRFVVTAKKAMRKAQHTAARENARFGLPLIVTR